MERTKEEWQAIGRVLAHGIYPGCYVADHKFDSGVVGPVTAWKYEGCYLRDRSQDPWLTLSCDHNDTVVFARVCNPPAEAVVERPLEGKEYEVTIEGVTYKATLK